MGGYLSLWAVYWGFKLATGKEGMGYGDFKLFAALGAWFGWQALVPIILIASVIGALVGIAMKLASHLREASTSMSATCWSSIDSKNPQPPVGCSSIEAFSRL